MELETLSEAGKAKIVRASVSLSLSPSTAKERSLAGSPAQRCLWGGEELAPRGSGVSGSQAAVCSVALLLSRGSSTNAAGGELRVWLFPVSLEGHAAARVACHSNKV